MYPNCIFLGVGTQMLVSCASGVNNFISQTSINLVLVSLQAWEANRLKQKMLSEAKVRHDFL